MAGKVLVVVAVAQGGDALKSAARGLAELSPFLAEMVDVLKTSTVRVLESALDRVLPAEGGDSDAVDTSDYDVQEMRLSVPLDEFGALRERWKLIANLGPSPAAEALEQVEKTPQFVEHVMRALYRAWDAAIGAPWYTRDFAVGFDLLSKDLRQLRGLLSAEAASPSEVVDALQDLERHLLILPAVPKPTG